MRRNGQGPCTRKRAAIPLRVASGLRPKRFFWSEKLLPEVQHPALIEGERTFVGGAGSGTGFTPCMKYA